MPEKHPIVQRCLDPGRHDKAVKHVSLPFAALVWYQQWVKGTVSEHSRKITELCSVVSISEWCGHL